MDVEKYMHGCVICKSQSCFEQLHVEAVNMKTCQGTGNEWEEWHKETKRRGNDLQIFFRAEYFRL
jgi:hypothetical protein